MWRREPSVAGSFYPSNPEKLSREIDRYLSEAGDRTVKGEVLALISPHAGYIYSGPVAAHSFKELKGKNIDLAVVIAPSHRARFDGASVIPEGAYVTPLGDVEVDAELGARLLQEKHFSFIKQVDEAEHSLEVQVPFLQKTLGNFKIVPIIVGCVDLPTCRTLAEELGRHLSTEKRSFVMVLSTDLSHYLHHQKARSVDEVFIESLSKFDEEDLYRVLSSDSAQACGEGAVLTGMIVAKKLGARKVDILKYATSGDTAGGKDQVVGYLSAAISK